MVNITEATNETMLDMYLFETTQMLQQLEQTIISCDKSDEYSQNDINEIFRFIHTIKGSSAMMFFTNISLLSHTIEDLFYYLREQKPQEIDASGLSDLVFESVDFIKIELEKIKSGDPADGDAQGLIGKLKDFLVKVKSESPQAVAIEKPFQKEEYKYIPSEKINELNQVNRFRANVLFNEDCEMENIRAFAIIHNLKNITSKVRYLPEEIIEDESTALWIRKNGFEIFLTTDRNYEEMHEFFMRTIFLKTLVLEQLESEDEFKQIDCPKKEDEQSIQKKVPHEEPSVEKKLATKGTTNTSQSMISVNVNKLDMLMDLVGEMVIAEAMVTQNPEVNSLEIENFQKAARQLHKITNELQDMVMAIRMVPLSTTFIKMQRIMRDMCKKLGKEVRLEVLGEETEVDKNIIENISDPLMHLIRNALDHGIEDNDERLKKGKDKVGTVTLEAKNSGSEVLISITDDGKGLDKVKILKKAKKNGLIQKPENEMTDQEIFNFILLPGFSTKETITEFSGRGVGMDVVTKNLEVVGGTVVVNSIPDVGTTITLKIPLTLTIIDGMNIKVGGSRYTIPIITIKESFRPKITELLSDPDGNEMIMIRGQCYPILRLHKYYNVKTEVTEFTEGVLIMVEYSEKSYCLFADELIGKQQVVVKALPSYIRRGRKINGLSGCTLLGDGNISLILDVRGLITER